MTISIRTAVNKIIYQVGQQIGSCTYLGQEYSKNWRRYALFKCECGKEFHSVIQKVKSGHTKTCGCAVANHLIKMNKKHGMTNTSEFDSWVCMKQRCNNPNVKEYKDYGARGIKVCERWEDSFENFFSDMGYKPSPKHQIDRIDNDGDYTPLNCKWSTRKEQCLNRRSNVLIDYNGIVKPLKMWTDELNLDYSKTSKRIREYKWPIERAFNNK